MNIFEEVKARVSARHVAENYGLKVGRNGMACCPFHNDKHPSMKIDDSHYHCFGCGAHGDAIGFVAAMFGLGQYEAACRINEDFNLGICVDASMSEAEQAELSRQIRNKKKITEIKDRFGIWKKTKTDDLLECERLIEKAEKAVMDSPDPHVVVITGNFVYLMHIKAIVGYWLDILCFGTEEETKEFFMTNGKEVDRIVANIKRAGNDILGRSRKAVG